MPTVRIPHDPLTKSKLWKPRHYQRSLWNALNKDGIKRAMEIWHRRSGKDETVLHWTCVAMHRRVGNYWHMLPEAAQARKAMWDAVDPHRMRKRIDVAFPEVLRKSTRNSDMFIEFKCGSTWQVIGSDNYNSLVGSPPIGIVFSEWALANPSAWGYLSPILEENDGWAVFITTPRGNNHAARMYHNALTDDKWHAGLLTPKETGMVDEATMERLKKDYRATHGKILGSALFDQEYLCSFEAAIMGAVYSQEMSDMRKDGRICKVPYDPSLPVETWWDLGWRDETAIWFIQRKPNGSLCAIDYEEDHLRPISHYVKLVAKKPYVYSQHLGPHDVEKGELGSGKTLKEQAASLGLKFTTQPRTSLEAGISATRQMLPILFIDAEHCVTGIEALSTYRYEWDEDKKVLSPKPVHDWASHGADALRTGAGSKAKKKRNKPQPNEVAVI